MSRTTAVDGVHAKSRGTNTVNLILEMKKQNKKDTKAHSGHKHWSLWTLVAMPTAPAPRPVGCVSGRTQTRRRSLAARGSGKHTSVFPVRKSPDLGRMLRSASQPEWLVLAPWREAWAVWATTREQDQCLQNWNPGLEPASLHPCRE